MANIFRKKYDIDNRVLGLETRKGSLEVANFHELWSTNAENRIGGSLFLTTPKRLL